VRLLNYYGLYAGRQHRDRGSLLDQSTRRGLSVACETTSCVCVDDNILNVWFAEILC
jgi:hypothetical protein